MFDVQKQLLEICIIPTCSHLHFSSFQIGSHKCNTIRECSNGVCRHSWVLCSLLPHVLEVESRQSLITNGCCLDEYTTSVTQQNSAEGGLAPPRCHLLHGNKIVRPSLSLLLSVSCRQRRPRTCKSSILVFVVAFVQLSCQRRGEIFSGTKLDQRRSKYEIQV